MNTKILIVEDQFIEADNLKSILRKQVILLAKLQVQQIRDWNLLKMKNPASYYLISVSKGS